MKTDARTEVHEVRTRVRGGAGFAAQGLQKGGESEVGLGLVTTGV